MIDIADIDIGRNIGVKTLSRIRGEETAVNVGEESVAQPKQYSDKHIIFIERSDNAANIVTKMKHIKLPFLWAG